MDLILRKHTFYMFWNFFSLISYHIVQFMFKEGALS
jgi:hypothetical protein